MNKLLDDAKAAGFDVQGYVIFIPNVSVDDITKELAKFAELQQPQWISVKDRLPEITDEYYLFGGFIHNGKWESHSMHWSTDIDYNMKILKFSELSHWMPLSSPPINTEVK